MTRLLPRNRVECLHEIRPGKICGAHRAASDPRCHVCGAVSETRPVVPTRVPRFIEEVTASGITVLPILH